MSPTSKTTEEPKATLPVGHPAAGYVSPDLSAHDGTGIIPDEEKAWHEQRNEAREEQLEAVADAEDKAKKDEDEARAKEAERIRKWKEDHPNPLDPPPGPPPADESKATPGTTTTKSTSSS